VHDEVADLILAQRGQQRGVQPQPPRANADIGRAAADIGSEAGDLLERRADIVRVQVDRGAADRQQVVGFCHHFHLVEFRSQEPGARIQESEFRICHALIVKYRKRRHSDF
jgi:hypothetical protein